MSNTSSATKRWLRRAGDTALVLLAAYTVTLISGVVSPMESVSEQFEFCMLQGLLFSVLITLASGEGDAVSPRSIGPGGCDGTEEARVFNATVQPWGGSKAINNKILSPVWFNPQPGKSGNSSMFERDRNERFDIPPHFCPPSG